jgi:hypothetical protein
MDPNNLICFNCKNFTPEKGGCKAFPDGIPNEIIESNVHDKPIEGQENDIIFEPIE